MKLKNLLLTGALLISSALSAQNSSGGGLPEVKATIYPAVYKSDKGPMQRVWITIPHEGKTASAQLRLGEQTQRVKLIEGDNKYYFEIPEVTASTRLPLTVEQGKELLAQKEITIAPTRHWQMNLVQHTHTDIGYTRSQMEILAEHLRYIDYALDYCDATDDYPENAKFRWTCEISWAVSEYLKNRPAEQIERLKQRVKEGRIELAAVNGIGWCFSEYFADAGIKYVNMGTHGHRALICFDKPTVFWWQSPSGKKVLAYRAEHYNQGNFFGVHTDDFETFETRVLEYLGQLEAKNYPYDICAAQHSGYFTDNAPPSTKSCEMVKRWNEKYEWPKLRTAVATEFIKTVEKEYAGKIETIRGAWPDWWTDGFASGAREAAVSRVTHSNIIAALRRTIAG